MNSGYNWQETEKENQTKIILGCEIANLVPFFMHVFTMGPANCSIQLEDKKMPVVFPEQWNKMQNSKRKAHMGIKISGMN